MYFLKMFKGFSIHVLFYFLIVIFSGLRSNHIHGYHLRGIPNLPEERHRLRGLSPHGGEDAESDVIWLNPGKRGLPNFTPYISVGVLSNLEEFFDNLSSNMDSIDEEKAVVNEIEADQPLKIKNPLAENYFRGYKPSYKIRNYVQSPDLGLLKGTNHHDPSLKWTGLGKRNRW